MSQQLKYTVVCVAGHNGDVVFTLDVSSHIPLYQTAYVIPKMTMPFAPTAHHLPPALHFLTHAQPASPQPQLQSPVIEEKKTDELKAFEDSADTIFDIIEPPVASSSSSVWNNPLVESALVKKAVTKKKPTAKPVKLVETISCFQKGYPPESNNLMDFVIPAYVAKSGSWILKFPDVVKAELVRLKVGQSHLRYIDEKWERFAPCEENDNDSSLMRIDYPQFLEWFKAFYNYTRDHKGNHKCVRFNRWHANDDYGCPDDCDFRHICAICGDEGHGAFDRDNKKKFVCKYTTAIVSQREAIIKAKYEVIAVNKELIRLFHNSKDKRKKQ
jgi:hypothetical protein